jgi:hypothetical protein
MDARADVPLRNAWITFHAAGDEDSAARFTSFDAGKLALLGLPNPLAVAVAHQVGGQAWARVPVELDESRTQLLIHFRPWLSGKYAIHIEDNSGLVNDYFLKIQVQPDPIPVVKLEQPVSNRAVLPKAEINLQIDAHDEKFGLRSVFLEFWRKDKHGYVVGPVQRLPLYNAGMAAKGDNQGVTDADGKPLTLPPNSKFKPDYLKVIKRWSLEGLVKEGDVLVIRAGADDHNDVAAMNTPGYSHEVELAIVGKTEMNISLDKAQATLQDKLARLKELQKGALENVEEIEQKWAKGKPLSADVLKKLLDKAQDADQWQKEMKDLIGKEKVQGLLQELEQLEGILKDNKIDSSDIKDRAKLIKAALKKIEKELQIIQPKLGKVKQQLSDLDPGKTSDQKTTKQELTDTKDHQKQVLKALDELLEHLDRWAVVHELRAAAHSLRERQTKLQAETEKLTDGFATQSKSWKMKIAQLADQQFQLATEAQRFVDKLKSTSEEQVDKNPDIAKILDEALLIAEELRLVGTMKDSDEQFRKQQLLKAIEDQTLSTSALSEIISALTEKRDNQLEKLIKQQGQAKGALKDFMDKLEKLQKQVEEAKKIANPEQQKKALQKLADDQQELIDEANKKVIELARLRADEASQDMNKAAKEMEQALKKLQIGGDPLDEQLHALEQLKKAEKDLQKAQMQAENELAREKLAKIADQILALKERQDALVGESERLNKLVLQEGWSRRLRISFCSHDNSQKLLGTETASLAEKLKGAKVFELILRKAALNMNEAAQALETRWKTGENREGIFPFSPEILKDEQQKHSTILKLQQQASERLQTLLDAVKEGQKQLQAKANEPDKEPPEQQPKGGLQAQDGIPPIAQLKALKAEQQSINERTKAFAKEYANMANLPPQAQAELDAIHADQEALFELFQEITAAANQGEKK